MKKLLLGIVIGALSFHAWQRINEGGPDVVAAPIPPDTNDIPVERANDAPAFRCDGRTRCTEMRSCEEALFFLRNCPGVKMDGDNDGLPCEEQWCKH